MFECLPCSILKIRDRFASIIGVPVEGQHVHVSTSQSFKPLADHEHEVSLIPRQIDESAFTMAPKQSGIWLKVGGILTLAAAAQAAPSVNVALRTSFGAPPYLVELL